MATVTCDGAGAATSNCGLTLDKWIKAMTVRLPGAPAALIRCELEQAVRDFYSKTGAWREVIGPLNITTSQYVFLNPVDSYCDVQHVFGAYTIINGARMDLNPMEWRRPGERPAAPQPDRYYCTEPSTLELYPTPQAALGAVLYVAVALAPVAGTERLPEIAATHHFDGILTGALARMYQIPLKPWTSKNLANDAEREYRAHCRTARDQATRGYTGMDVPVRFPRWA